MALMLHDLRRRSLAAVVLRGLFTVVFFLAAGLMPAARACQAMPEQSSHHHAKAVVAMSHAHDAGHAHEQQHFPACSHDCCLNGCALPLLPAVIGVQDICVPETAVFFADDLLRHGYFPPVATPPPRAT